MLPQSACRGVVVRLRRKVFFILQFSRCILILAAMLARLVLRSLGEGGLFLAARQIRYFPLFSVLLPGTVFSAYADFFIFTHNLVLKNTAVFLDNKKQFYNILSAMTKHIIKL